MSLLYLVTESDRDAAFYQKCAVHFGRRQFAWWGTLRNRKADGSDAVKEQLNYMLRLARAAAAGGEEVCFIAAIDNDRSPHPENEGTLQRAKLSRNERDRPARLPWIEGAVVEVLGHDRAVWPLRVGFAVPVEMLESWTVKALDADKPGGATPHFSRQDQQRAREYYHPVKPPLQWKDLEQEARAQCQMQNDETFYEHVVVVVAANPQELSAKSPSFEHFHQQLAAW